MAARKSELRPWLSFLSVVALLCLSLDVELVQQIDSLRLYLTTGEIALEVCVALLLSLFGAFAWWFCVLLLGQLLGIYSRTLGSPVHWCWSLWIGAPLSYLVLEIFENLKLLAFPNWHSGRQIQVQIAFGLVAACGIMFRHSPLLGLQGFCRTRLVPIGVVHLFLGFLSIATLSARPAKLFTNYVRMNTATISSSQPDIYLITIDALKADNMSTYGYNRPTTPDIDQFAENSVSFDYFFADSNFTTAATTSIETGALPWSHRVFQHGAFLREGYQRRTLAEVLRQQGYYTAMISANPLAAPFRHRTLESYDAVEYVPAQNFEGTLFRETNLIGLNSQATLAFSLFRGLSTLTAFLDARIWRDRYPSPAEQVFDQARDLLGRTHLSGPYFVWTHVLPPHDPYCAPPPYRHRFVSATVGGCNESVGPDSSKHHSETSIRELHASYDEMIMYADHAVGDYLNWLKQTGRFAKSIVIISADHGELFDHDRLGHGGPDLYNGVIHIPLLVHLPGQQRPIRVNSLAQQADLLPTILDLIGAPPVSWTDGISLKPALEGKRLPERYIFSMNLEPDRIFDPISKGTIAVIDGEYKFIRYLKSGKEQLFRYKDDPAEEQNLVDAEPQIAERLRVVLLKKLAEVNTRFGTQQ